VVLQTQTKQEQNKRRTTLLSEFSSFFANTAGGGIASPTERLLSLGERKEVEGRFGCVLFCSVLLYAVPAGGCCFFGMFQRHGIALHPLGVILA
jgi:hypothetical protein